MKIELADDVYTFRFAKSGLAYNGIHEKKLYKMGLLVTADPDDKYMLAYNAVDACPYVVNVNGSILADHKTAKDGDDGYFARHGSAIVYVEAGENASKAASEFARNGAITSYSVNYTVY
ncbi:MAG: hypothetical protein IKQ69_06830 [Oscillospiraceae bacterium]|nr:hypothetical protein [Oscillospiraceae bacterium]MBR6208696.1 hypothetical protein [Oscillospiraceae bacterium]